MGYSEKGIVLRAICCLQKIALDLQKIADRKEGFVGTFERQSFFRSKSPLPARRCKRFQKSWHEPCIKKIGVKGFMSNFILEKLDIVQAMDANAIHNCLSLPLQPKVMVFCFLGMRNC
jgi:hypothetical protein